MIKCSICGAKLTENNLVKGILNPAERARLKVVRTEKGVCSECSIQMLMLDIIG